MIVILLLMHLFIYCTIQQYCSRLCAKVNTIQRVQRDAAPNLPSYVLHHMVMQDVVGPVMTVIVPT
jgi:hypothetical protein